MTQTQCLPAESSLPNGTWSPRIQGDDSVTRGHTGSAGGTTMPGVADNRVFPEEVTAWNLGGQEKDERGQFRQR